jgi:hypothetical protein
LRRLHKLVADYEVAAQLRDAQAEQELRRKLGASSLAGLSFTALATVLRMLCENDRRSRCPRRHRDASVHRRTLRGEDFCRGWFGRSAASAGDHESANAEPDFGAGFHLSHLRAGFVAGAPP